MNANHRSRSPNKGFTLAELLTVLAVLGIMASFSIPKIIIATQEKIAIQKYKTIISELSTICYQAWQKDAIHSQADVVNYLKSNLSYVSYNNIWPGHVFVLHDGSKFSVSSYFTDPGKINQQIFVIEVKNMNFVTQGDDWIYISFNFDKNHIAQSASYQPAKPGTINSGIHGHPVYAPTAIVWQQIFPGAL